MDTTDETKAEVHARLSGSKRKRAAAGTMVVYDPAVAARHVAAANHRLLHARTKTAPRRARLAGRKRAHAAGTMVVYDPAVAARHAAAAAAAPRVNNDGEPIDAVPLAFAPPAIIDPWWIRRNLFPILGLRDDLPVHFIDEKTMTNTDLAPHQNRLRLPTAGVVNTLRPLLTVEELEAANLHEEAMGPKQKSKEEERKKGKKHGGLPVVVVNPAGGGDMKNLQLTQWDGSKGVIIKGEGYSKFISECGFMAGDVVELFAFKQRHVRLFDVTLCEASPLFIAIVKKE